LNDDDDDEEDDFLEQLVGETEVLGGNLPRGHFVHHKIPHDDPVSNPGPQQWEARD
jgi:hypothetical protein